MSNLRLHASEYLFLQSGDEIRGNVKLSLAGWLPDIFFFLFQYPKGGK